MAIDPVLINLVRRFAVATLAQSIIGVQPISGRTGSIFSRSIRKSQQEHRHPISKEHYKTFLRLNDRPRTQPLRAFQAAGYPIVDLASFRDVIQAQQWCREQFGDHGFLRLDQVFVFRSEADATAFRMRWL